MPLRFAVVVIVVLVLLLVIVPQSQSFVPFNLFNLTLHPPPFSPSAPPFLQDVVRAIATEEDWDPSGDVRVSNLDAANARIGDSQRYDLRMRVGRTVLVLKSWDEIESVKWSRWEGVGELGRGFVVERRASVRGFELEGPLEVRVSGVGSGDGDRISLFLPSLNITHKGLRRVLVGDGISIKVEGAQGVLVVHPCSLGPSRNGSSAAIRTESSSHPFSLPSCSPLPSIRVIGLATLHAFRTRAPEVFVKIVFLSPDTVELLPDKCYDKENFKRRWPFLLESLSSRFEVMEKTLMSFLGENVLQNKSISISEAKIMSVTLVKFRFELERDITENDRIWKRLENWKTKPIVERHWFDIVARAEEGKRLKPVTIKKSRRPLFASESTSLNNLLSNISLAELLSFVVSPEALTLDVKW